MVTAKSTFAATLPVITLWVHRTTFLPSVSTDDRLVLCFSKHNQHRHGSTAGCKSVRNPRREPSTMGQCVPVSTEDHVSS